LLVAPVIAEKYQGIYRIEEHGDFEERDAHLGVAEAGAYETFESRLVTVAETLAGYHSWGGTRTAMYAQVGTSRMGESETMR